MEQQEIQTLLVNQSLRTGRWAQLQTVCNKALATRASDHAALFWRTVGLLQESRTSEVSSDSLAVLCLEPEIEPRELL